MKRILYIFILSISLALLGCNDSGSNVNDNPQTDVTDTAEQFDVIFSITIPDEVEAFESIEQENVTVEEGDTIIEVTEKSGNELDVNGSGENAYVEGINELYSFDEGPSSGWLVKVNGEFINVGPGAYNVEEGDTIEWLYTLDFNKEFE